MIGTCDNPKVCKRFCELLPGGYEDILCIHVCIEDSINGPNQKHRALCNIIGILHSFPVLLDMHNVDIDFNDTYML